MRANKWSFFGIRMGTKNGGFLGPAEWEQKNGLKKWEQRLGVFGFKMGAKKWSFFWDQNGSKK